MSKESKKKPQKILDFGNYTKT